MIPALAELEQLLQQSPSWEARNRLLVQLSRQLPAFDEAKRSEENRVSGCESQVWLSMHAQNERWQIRADSDSRMIKGLLLLVLAAFDGRNTAEILTFDFSDWLEQQGLQRFLTASRGNGLKAIVNTIRQQCSGYSTTAI